MYSICAILVLLITTMATSGRCDNTEAIAIALEASGQLLAPEALVQKITEDLNAIRGAYPSVKSVVGSPPWVVGQLLAVVSDEQLQQIRDQYGEVTASDPLFDTLKVLTFAAKYNPVVLANELVSKNLVTSAEPNGIVGQSNTVRYNAESGLYTFTKGWGDCPSGCINRQIWEFSVSQSKEVKLIKDYGPSLEV